jgi:hypothetical protein
MDVSDSKVVWIGKIRKTAFQKEVLAENNCKL